MLNFLSTDKLRVTTTGATVSADCIASGVDLSASGVAPWTTPTTIATATTTDVMASPAASTYRNLKHFSHRNKHASAAHGVQVEWYNGTAYELFECSLLAGETLVFNDGQGWQVFDVGGNVKTVLSPIGTFFSMSIATGQHPVTSPVAPGTGTASFWFQKWAGRPFMVTDGDALGDGFRDQPALFANGITLYKPASSTTVGSYLGGVLTSGGTVSHPAAATTNFRTQQYHTIFSNIVTTTNQFLGVRDNNLKAWRGNAAGQGGFFFHARFSFPLFPAGSRVFIGLTSLTTGVHVTADPSGAAADHIGLAMDIADTNLTIMCKDGTTNTKNAIGGGLARTANDVYDLYFYCKPNDTKIYVTLISFAAASGVGTVLLDTSYTTNIPRNTIFLEPMAAMSNGTANTTVDTVQIGLMSMYLERNW